MTCESCKNNPEAIAHHWMGTDIEFKACPTHAKMVLAALDKYSDWSDKRTDDYVKGGLE